MTTQTNAACAAASFGPMNGLLTSTWNRLEANGTPFTPEPLREANPFAVSLNLPVDVMGHDQDSFNAAWACFEQRARDISAERVTVRSTEDVSKTPFEAFAAAAADELDVPARNAIPRSATDAALGDEASAALRAQATAHSIIDVAPYHEASAPVVMRTLAQDGAFAVGSLDVYVHEGARLDLVLEADSPSAGAGAVGMVVRIIADAGSRVNIKQLQTLGSTWDYLESIEIKTADSARVDVDQVYLGGKRSFLGFGNALLGHKSVCNIATHYLGAGSSALDFNYLIRQFGKQSKSNLIANGVLIGKSSKLLRGTIDLIHGCKAAVGYELETVLLANEGVRNRTIPIILCDDDDVQGTHGATIGHVPASQRHYLASRGLSDAQIEALFTRSLFEKALIDAFNDDSKAAISRLAATSFDYELGDVPDERDEESIQAAIDAKLAAGLAAGAAARLQAQASEGE